jgi:hypothetical protein
MISSMSRVFSPADLGLARLMLKTVSTAKRLASVGTRIIFKFFIMFLLILFPRSPFIRNDTPLRVGIVSPLAPVKTDRVRSLKAFNRKNSKTEGL